jgi:hypothetical protein
MSGFNVQSEYAVTPTTRTRQSLAVRESRRKTIQSTNNPAHKQSSPSEPVAQKQVRPESRCVMNFKNTVAATFALWAQFCGSIQAAPARPNVLLIMTDNERRHCSTHARREIRAADFGFRVEAWITNSLYCRVTSHHSTTVRSEFRQRHITRLGDGANFLSKICH